MSYAAIRDQLQAIVGGVSGMGAVHNYQRLSKDWGKFLEHFKDQATGRINGCAITRTSKSKRQITLGEVEIAHIFSLRFYYSLVDSDASELDFQDLIESVDDAIDADEQLNGTCDTTHPDWGPMSGAVGLQVESIDIRMFGNVLCHFADARLCAVESKDA